MSTAPAPTRHLSALGTCRNVATAAPAPSPRDSGGEIVRLAAFDPSDPHQVALHFPEDWARLMHEVYGGRIRDIILQFDVTERTARRWLAAEGGVNGRHTIIAQRAHPEAYLRLVVNGA